MVVTQLPGVGADDITLSDGMRLADIDDTFGAVTWDFGVGKVAEFTVPAVDIGGRLSQRRLLREGVTLRFDSQPWMIAACERDYRGEDIWLNWTARSRLARRLRNMTGPDSTRHVTPAGWIVPRVKKAGGVALVEPGAKRRHIVQKRNQSVLAVIESLASDTGVEWVEFDGQVFVGTPWWAFQGHTGLPTWEAAVTGQPSVLASRTLAVAGLQTRSSQDDRGQAATASMTVEPRDGVKVRPWHRINITGADADDNGLWLVTNNSFDNKGPQASLSLQRPLKTHPKKGSQGSPGGTDDGSSGETLTPVAGSSYTDAQRPANWSGRSVDAILSMYRAHRGGLGPAIVNGCLWYAQEVAGYSHVGQNPHVLWVMLATSKRHTSRTVVPGAVMLYRNSHVGHATVYLGGGQVLSTDMNEAGAFASGQWSIGPADAAERSFGSLLGWYSPP